MALREGAQARWPEELEQPEEPQAAVDLLGQYGGGRWLREAAGPSILDAAPRTARTQAGPASPELKGLAQS